MSKTIYLHGDYTIERLLKIAAENQPELVFEENQKLMDEKIALIDLVKQDFLFVELSIKLAKQNADLKTKYQLLKTQLNTEGLFVEMYLDLMNENESLRKRIHKLMNPLG